MNITYTGRHTKVYEEMKEYLEKRMYQKVKFYFDHIIQVSVVVEHHNNSYTFEVKIKADHDSFFAKETYPTWQESIDNVTDTIAAAVKKKRDKVTQHH